MGYEEPESTDHPDSTRTMYGVPGSSYSDLGEVVTAITIATAKPKQNHKHKGISRVQRIRENK